ncbi:Hypothetical predicted protein, partial [Pelobates cultripes]
HSRPQELTLMDILEPGEEEGAKGGDSKEEPQMSISLSERSTLQGRKNDLFSSTYHMKQKDEDCREKEEEILSAFWNW